MTDVSEPTTIYTIQARRARQPYCNPLREKLRRGERTLGLWITLSAPAVTEIAAQLGLDWVCVDMEHGATDFADLTNHLRAAKGTGLAVFARVSSISSENIARCLDLGVDGIVLPMVRSAEEVRRALDWMLYPPRGSRGLGGERAQKWGLGVDDYVASANDELILMPMIEHIDAVNCIDEIFAIPGLDFFFVGPGDLSSSLGHCGEWSTPETAKAIAHVLERAKVHGVTPGIYAHGTAEVKQRTDEGFRIIAMGSDLPMMITKISTDLAVIAAEANGTDTIDKTGAR